MKVFLIQAGLLWLAIVAEQARSDFFPAYSLLLPICSVCFIARKSTSSILLVGSALLIQDLLRMETQPFVTVGLLIVGTCVLTRPDRDPLSRRSKLNAGSRLPTWLLQSAAILSCGILLHFGPRINHPSVTLSTVQNHLTVTGPVFLMAVAVLRISREFGMRHAFH